jgi:hypothetical protein
MVGKQIDTRDVQLSNGNLESTMLRPLKHMYIELSGLLGVPASLANQKRT